MLLIGLPTAFFFVVPFAVPAAFLLTPVAIFGLAGTLLEGGPRLVRELWVGAGILLTALLAICTIVALLCLLGLAATFLLRGRAGLGGQSRLLRYGILFGTPPFLLVSIPSLVTAFQTYPFVAADRLLPALLYSGLPLLVPAVHVAWEVRASLQSATPSGRVGYDQDP